MVVAGAEIGLGRLRSERCRGLDRNWRTSSDWWVEVISALVEGRGYSSRFLSTREDEDGVCDMLTVCAQMYPPANGRDEFSEILRNNDQEAVCSFLNGQA